MHNFHQIIKKSSLRYNGTENKNVNWSSRDDFVNVRFQTVKHLFLNVISKIILLLTDIRSAWQSSLN